MRRRQDDRREWMYLVAGLVIIGLDFYYVKSTPTADRYIVLGVAAIGAGIISRTFMGDLVNIAKARFGKPDA